MFPLKIEVISCVMSSKGDTLMITIPLVTVTKTLCIKIIFMRTVDGFSVKQHDIYNNIMNSHMISSTH